MIGRVMSRRPAAMRALTRLQYREAILHRRSPWRWWRPSAGWSRRSGWRWPWPAQLAIGGIGAVWLIGPARTELGFARYATLATAGVTLTLFGRLLVPSIGLLLTPIAALLLFGVIRLELGLTEAGQRRVGLDLALVGIVFAAAAGIGGMIPADAWPPGLILLLILASVPAPAVAPRRAGGAASRRSGRRRCTWWRSRRSRPPSACCSCPGVVGAAIVALGFHAWGGAAEALDDGASGRSVVLEFGAWRCWAWWWRCSCTPAEGRAARGLPARSTRVDTPRGRCYNKAPSGRNGPLRTCHRPFSTTISRERHPPDDARGY